MECISEPILAPHLREAQRVILTVEAPSGAALNIKATRKMGPNRTIKLVLSGFPFYIAPNRANRLLSGLKVQITSPNQISIEKRGGDVAWLRVDKGGWQPFTSYTFSTEAPLRQKPKGDEGRVLITLSSMKADQDHLFDADDSASGGDTHVILWHRRPFSGYLTQQTAGKLLALLGSKVEGVEKIQIWPQDKGVSLVQINKCKPQRVQDIHFSKREPLPSAVPLRKIGSKPNWASRDRPTGHVKKTLVANEKGSVDYQDFPILDEQAKEAIELHFWGYTDKALYMPRRRCAALLKVIGISLERETELKKVEIGVAKKSSLRVKLDGGKFQKVEGFSLKAERTREEDDEVVSWEGHDSLELLREDKSS